MTQSLPKLIAFQSKHCIGWVTIVRWPIRHPIHRRMEFERIVPAKNRQRPPAPDEEAVLREEVGEVPPGPERRRVIGSPFAADKGFLDRDAEQDQTDLGEHQGNERAGDRVCAQSQQANDTES